MFPMPPLARERLAACMIVAIALRAGVNAMASAAAQPGDSSCVPIDGIGRVLAPGTVTLFGELHGTNEAPAFVGNVLCDAAGRHVPVTLAVELPKTSTAALRRYVKSAGTADDRTALLADEAWHMTPLDGRTSEAMLRLVESARLLVARGGDIDVLAFSDTAPTGQMRDALMAQTLAEMVSAQPGRAAVVLTGNIHSRIAIGTGFDAGYRPMGYLLRARVAGTTVLGLNVSYDAGEAWICVADAPRESACGPRAVKGQRRVAANAIEMSRANAAYDGFFGVGALTASKPAVP